MAKAFSCSQLYAQSDSLLMATLTQKMGQFSQLLEPEPDSAYHILEEVILLCRDAENWDYYAFYSLNLTLTIAQDQTRFWQAYQKGLEVRDSLRHYLTENSPYYASALANLGFFCREIGQLEEARNYYDQSLAIQAAQKTPNYEGMATVYYMLGTVFFMEGDWLEARAHIEKALAILQAHQLLDKAVTRNCQLHLGIIYRKMEDWKHSRKYYGSCLQAPEPQNSIEAGYGMAWTYIEATDAKADSAQYFLDYANALQVAEKPYLPQMAAEIQGKIHDLQDMEDHALHHLQQAQQLRLQYNPDGYDDLARGEQELAEQFAQKAAFDSAFAHLHKALAYLHGDIDNALSETLIFPQVALPIYIQAGSLYQQKFEEKGKAEALKKGLQCFEQAFLLYHRLREDRTQEASKLLLAEQLKAITSHTLEALEILLEQFPAALSAEQAFLCMERYHAGILHAERQRSERFLLQGLPDSLQKQEKNLLAHISFLQAQLQREKDSLSVAKTQENLFSHRERYRLFRERMADSWPIYGQQTEPMSLLQVQKNLKKMKRKEAVAAFFWGKEAIWLVFAHDGEVQLSRLSSTAYLEPQIEQLLHWLDTPDYSKEHGETFVRLSTFLYQHLLAASLNPKSIEKLFIIPDGRLNLLPFEILLEKERQDISFEMPAVAYRKLSYLCRHKEIAYGHSLALILQSPTNRSPRAHELAVMAPTYTGMYALQQNENIGALLLDEMTGNSFVAAQANKTAFMEEASRYGYLHLSVHGYANEKNPWDAYLQFAPHADQNERLYVHEIYNCHLPSSLVTLAACDVGKGKDAAGEGLLSLARAFQFAGAATVIQSRWRADARAAELLFPAFYQRLAHADQSLSAFSAARTKFLAEAPPELTHPHYWANFAHWGQVKQAKAFAWWQVVLGVLLFGGMAFFLWKRSGSKP